MEGEATFTTQISCPFCNNTAPMKQLSLTTVRTELLGSGNSYIEDISRNLYWQIVECPACHKHLLREGWYTEELDDEIGPRYRIIYPQTKRKDYNLPEKLKKAYIAAQRVKNIDPNAFAVLLGRILDMICIEKNAHGRTLSDKIKNMFEMGIIPEQISQIALGLKDFRNIGAHADLGELSDAEIPIVEELINVVLEYVYEAPAMIDKVRNEIDKLKGKKPE